MKQDNKEAEMDRPYFEPWVGRNYNTTSAKVMY